MAEPRPCRNIVCDQQVGAWSPHEFCTGCMAQLVEMRGELDKLEQVWLSLEDEFVTWCAEHGQPHPHE